MVLIPLYISELPDQFTSFYEFSFFMERESFFQSSPTFRFDPQRVGHLHHVGDPTPGDAEAWGHKGEANGLLQWEGNGEWYHFMGNIRIKYMKTYSRMIGKKIEE